METTLALLGDVSLTEFVLGRVELPDDEPAESQARLWPEQVAEGVRSGRLRTWTVEPERLIRFDNLTWHRTRPAREAGWRLLLRAIRGLPTASGGGAGTLHPGPFTTIRNGYVPETPDEQLRYEPYLR